MKTINVFEINQPVGTFYLGKINSIELLEISEIKRISENLGPQRDIIPGKIKSLEKYCKTDNAAFPTPIIISIDSKELIDVKDDNGFSKIIYDERKTKAEIIDGQHRILGLNKSKISMDLPIVIMFDLTPEDKAYIFTAINQNQTKVNKSNIYQLFELNETRSPIKVCHNIAVFLNNEKKSPFYHKIKMLGKRTNETETLSQAAFIDYLLPMFPSEDRKTHDNEIFSKFYEKEEDDTITKIILNYFSAIQTVFSKEWNDNQQILSKTTGYGALCKAFPSVFKYGVKEKNISEKFFEMYFNTVKNRLDNSIKFVASSFGSGEKAQKELAEYFIYK